MSLVREDLNKLRVVPASALADMANQDVVRVAGLVLVRQKPATASGTIFMTIEDETGTVNLILWPRVWERFRHAVRSAVAVLVQGRIDRAGRVIHVAPTMMEDLTQSLRGLAAKSRDFH